MSKELSEPSVLVVYQSQTGNTKKVAQAIYDAIPEPKEMKTIKQAKSLEGYSLIFLGFPTHGSGPNKETKTYLENNTKGKQIALFITHAAPVDAPEIPESLQKFRDAACEADIIDLFHCRGQLDKIIKLVMRFVPDPKVREWAKSDNSEGQPDKESLEKATLFASKVIEKHRIQNRILQVV